MRTLIEIARAEIGYKEQPTNITKYGKWFGLDGVAWCGIFVSWCYFKAGKQLPRIGYLKGFAGCQTAVKYFRENGKIVTTPIEGDIVFFDWNKDGKHDHTGLFVRKLDDKTFLSIEGNTSATNNSNGGEVQERIRSFSHAIFARP